jgi:hypothetical protein
VAFLVVSLGAAAASAQRLRSVVSEDDVRIIYPGERYDFLVPHAAACIDNSFEFHRRLYDWQDVKPTTVFLQDFGDSGNGYANTVPKNWINLGLAPMDYTYETVPAIDRFYWLANHEVAHLATMDQPTGSDLAWRKFFAGKILPVAEDPLSIFYNYATNPRWNAPRWYHEGIAVFLETWMAGGYGRALGAYDEMVFRSMVLDDAYFYRIGGLLSEGTATDFQVGVNAYLYGTRFMTYLAYTYGPEKLIEWTARRPGSKAHFAKQFEHVYGAKMREEWEKWIDFEREWQLANLERIRENPVTHTRALSDTAVGSVSRVFLDDERGKAYMAVRYPGEIAHLAALDLETGELEKIQPLKGPALYYVTSLAYDPDDRRFFYTTDNYEWRDLWTLELDTGKKLRLGNDFRFGDIVFSRTDKSLWGVRKLDGRSILVRVPYPYNSSEEMYRLPFGRDLYDIDVSPDGRFITGGLAERDGSQSLVFFRVEELENQTAEPVEVFDFADSLAANFVFSDDGRSLWGSSYYSGVSNIYRYDLDKQEMFVLSNAETGLFRPQPLSDQEIFALRYTGEGFIPVAIPREEIDNVSAVRFMGTALTEEQPLVREWTAGAPETADFEHLEPQGYAPLRHMKLDSVQPILRGYKDSVSGGVRLDFGDGIGLSRLRLAASYSPDSELDYDERVHLDAELALWKWNLRATLNRDNFYDLFGPTKRSRRGYSLELEWDDILVYDDPRFWRLETGGSYWGDLETLPGYQEIDARLDQLLGGWATIEYEHVRKSLGAVDEEKGMRWRLEGAVDSPFSSEISLGDEVVPRFATSFDFGLPVGIKHSSIWLRTSAGHAFGDLNNEFAKFFFGGFGNNYVDSEPEKRYREYESFPGIEINQVGGRNFARALLEWNLPPVRFRKAGKPSFYFNWMRPAIFGGVLETDLDQGGRISRSLTMVGAQLDFKMVLFSNLPSKISFGYGVAWEDGKSSDEIMVSLKIL